MTSRLNEVDILIATGGDQEVADIVTASIEAYEEQKRVARGSTEYGDVEDYEGKDGESHEEVADKIIRQVFGEEEDEG